ncbi:hypothetical protein UFOVP352_29 [uncultured Caudovirales phage]|uniref:Uncharacterized protein n=1 Tax=uncultured Caudovirales phage TaxID=2100421 RepID=A0A6J5STQ9_9CAUD|nr:hypothetical protein UFOVP352_29 [uncultured Caudovirales phage]CAB4218650.1 hypothetical protein UFOVP1607_33 [uncultured Caudovirales phage]
MHDEKCLSCEKRSLNLISGIYKAQCIMCCADLMLTAYPSKKHASTLIASLLNFKDAPPKEKILDELKNKLKQCA